MEDFKTQIENLIDSFSIYQKEELMNEYSDNIWEDIGINAKCVEDYGGEDQGSTYYAVWELTSDNGEVLYVKFYGYYASYHGADYEGWCFVTPKQKTITVYE